MKQRVAQAFATRIKQGDLSHLQVVYRAVGGMPSQRLDYTVTVDPVDGAKVMAYDARIARTVKQALIPPENFDVAALFKQLSAGLHSLLPASETAFLPDALVGSMAIRIGADEEIFYFVPGISPRGRQGSRVAPSMNHALQQLWGIATRVLESQKGNECE